MAEETGGTPTAAPGRTCAYPHCGEPAWPDSPEGHCLYHWEGNGQDEQTARRVWQEARRRAQDPKGCDFQGWHLPFDWDHRRFVGMTFHGPARFSHATFLNGALFSDATFECVVEFEHARFQSDADFDGATFQSDARLTGVSIEGYAQFTGAFFQGKADFDDATFQGKADFRHATFQGQAKWWSACFQDEADFGSAAFQDIAWFKDAIFQGFAQFEDASFQGPAWFSGAAFEEWVEFAGAAAKPGADVAFDLPSATRPFRHREHGEAAYRLAKQAAQDRGDYRRAGDYHYAEQCAIECGRRKEAERWPWRKGFWGQKGYPHCLLELIFARCLFGYGEKPQRVLIAGLLVIVLWAGLFWGQEAIGPGWLPGTDAGFVAYRPTLGECFHFSAVTFTTLGYGDFRPKPGHRLLADAEAVTGAALMALFIVGLARKYTR